jgi:hypothetical protein
MAIKDLGAVLVKEYVWVENREGLGRQIQHYFVAREKVAHSHSFAYQYGLGRNGLC